MRAIGRALACMDVDVAGLQEVFWEGDRRLIALAAAEGGLAFSHYFQSGLMGSGLFILSRYPIDEASFLRFRLNGRPQDLIRSDYYAGKGVGRARILTPAGPVDIYNAHFIAPYLEFGPDRFAAHRVTQALEAGRYMRATSGAVPAVLTCDLNCYPDDLTYQTLVGSGGLVETYSAAHLEDSEPPATDRSGYATIHPPARFDYVFARSGTADALKVAGSRFVFGGVPQPNPDGVRGYSDHYGVLTEFEIAPAAEALAVEATVPAAPAEPALLSSIGEFLGLGIHRNRRHRRKASFVAAAASVTSAALLGPRRPRPTGSGGRALVAALLAGLLVAGGVNLSTAARLNTETNTLATLLGEDL